MKLLFRLENYHIDYNALEKFGFVKKEQYWIYRYPIPNYPDFSAIFTIQDHIYLEIFDGQQEYELFFVKNAKGSFVEGMRLEINSFLQKMIDDCLEKVDIEQLLIDYVYQTYGTTYQTPWEDHPNYKTLKTNQSQKWYGLFMDLTWKVFDKDKIGSIKVLNIKLPSHEILSIIDHVHYFPAYHMNKKHWISIVLDKNIDLEKVKQYIDQSYCLVEKK